VLGHYAAHGTPHLGLQLVPVQAVAARFGHQLQRKLFWAPSIGEEARGIFKEPEEPGEFVRVAEDTSLEFPFGVNTDDNRQFFVRGQVDDLVQIPLLRGVQMVSGHQRLGVDNEFHELEAHGFDQLNVFPSDSHYGFGRNSAELTIDGYAAIQVKRQFGGWRHKIESGAGAVGPSGARQAER